MKPFTILACLVSLASAFAQQPSGKLAFEVASIKPTDPDPASRIQMIGMKADGDTVHYTNITLRDCIRAAYRVRDFQIQGPDWMSTARFEINAKLPTGASMDQIPEMMQSLLAERFGMTLQQGTKEQSVYALVAGKDGPKLKPPLPPTDNPGPTALGPDGKPRPLIMIGFPASGVVIHAPAVTLAALAEAISRFTFKPVVDMTGIEGRYQFELTFEPETMGGISDPRVAQDGTKIVADPAPLLSNAVQQYGLRIEARKAQLELLTVTHVEKTPTEN
jgi:uncharacterized protein (TIGR03435 family)